MTEITSQTMSTAMATAYRRLFVIILLFPVFFAFAINFLWPHWQSYPLEAWNFLPLSKMNVLEGFIRAVQAFLASPGAPTAILRQGTLVGIEKTDNLPKPVEAFLGVPYAQPPTGDKRFRPTEKLDTSNDLIKVTSYGPKCYATSSSDEDFDEDCLKLNLFRPKLDEYKDANLPVSVYIHGGSFNTGQGKSHDDALMMAWSEKPYIAINFNYRLGALGFLSSKVAKEDGPLNVGLRDQTLLLEWVQHNIKTFGGDPDQVTLFGFSAGAHSVSHHLMRTTKPDLFCRAMPESGSPTARAVLPYDSDLSEEQFNKFLDALDCKKSSDDDIMPCLRDKKAIDVAVASNKIYKEYEDSDRWAFQAVIDGDVIKEAPIHEWESGNWNKVPILTGFNTDEGSTFVPDDMSTSEEFTEFFEKLIPGMSDDDIDKLNDLYPDPLKDSSSPYVETRDIDVGPEFKRATAAYGQYAYICPVRQTAKLASAGQSESVYLYHWAVNKTVKGGASHGDQTAYEVYDPDVRKISDAQKELAGTLHAYFTSFITTGDPNEVKGNYPDRPTWEKYESESDTKLMLFGKGNDERAGGGDTGTTAQMADNDWPKEECDFWWDKVLLSES